MSTTSNSTPNKWGVVNCGQISKHNCFVMSRTPYPNQRCLGSDSSDDDQLVSPGPASSPSSGIMPSKNLLIKADCHDGSTTCDGADVYKPASGTQVFAAPTPIRQSKLKSAVSYKVKDDSSDDEDRPGSIFGFPKGFYDN